MQCERTAKNNAKFREMALLKIEWVIQADRKENREECFSEGGHIFLSHVVRASAAFVATADGPVDCCFPGFA
jgi:hypothetical protein